LVGAVERAQPATPRRLARAGALLPILLAHAGALVAAALLLLAAGQPIFAEDTWLHLSLGRSYLAHGPWLEADPLLHTAQGPPTPSAWLFAVVIHGLEQLVGLQGLRVVHATGVAVVLGLAWTSLRRTSGSPAFASLGTSLFVVLSTYRLFQLRPHLFTIFATLLLLRLLIVDGAVPSWRRSIGVAGLFALWANLHGGFVLGLVLLGAAVLAQALIAIPDPRQRPRAARLAAVLGLAGVATLANPAGAEPHLLYFAAGVETPALGMVLDEWAPVALGQLPTPRVPPSLLAWATLWTLLLLTPVAGLRRLRADRRDTPLVALSLVSLLAALSAVRLLWLGVVPLLLLGRTVRGARHTVALRWTAAVAAALLAPAFFVWGDWPMVSRGVHRSLYGLPYAVSKQDTHAVWFLRDAQLEGNLWNDYATGNFLGYWLAPRLEVFVNGSLNVPPDVMQAGAAISRRTGSADESFSGLLDRYRIDVFFGTGLPRVSPPGRARAHTTTHLEGEPDWIPVFRSPRSGVYLRRNARNAQNLARVADYYDRAGVPFDPQAGFDPGRALERAPRWALLNGIVPVGLPQLQAAAGLLGPASGRFSARQRLAELSALLGDYARAASVDRGQLAHAPGAVLPRRRLVWSLLHLRRSEESLEAAEALDSTASTDDALSQLLVAAARRHAGLPEAEGAALVAGLPLLTDPEARSVMARLVGAEARSR
jgi:hypothetical protein